MLKFLQWFQRPVRNRLLTVAPQRLFVSRYSASTLAQEAARIQRETPNDTSALAAVYKQLVSEYWKEWNLQQAKATLGSLKSLLESDPGTQKDALGECLFELGEVYYNLRESSQAKDFYQAALRQFQSAQPVNSLNVAKAYYGLGNAHQSLAEFTECKNSFQEAESLADAAGTQREKLLSLIHQGYSLMYRTQKNLEEAKKHADSAVRLVAEKTDRSSSQVLADAYECVGDVHFDRRELRQAVDEYHKALRLKKVLYVGQHPEVGKCLGKLGVALLSNGQFKEAVEVLKEKLEFDKKALGEVHQTVAEDYHDLGFGYVQQHQMDSADAAYTSELRIREANRSDAKALASVHLNLLNVKLNVKQVPAALQHGLKGIEILRKSGLGKEQLAHALGQMGDVYLRIKNLQEAKRMFEEAHAVRTAIYPSDHLEVGKSLVSLGQALGMMNESEAAEANITKGVEIMRKSLKREDVALGIALAKQGTAYASNKRLDPAIASFKEAVLIFRKGMTLAAPSTVNASLQLVSLYMATNRLLEAENVYRRLVADIEHAQKQSLYDFPRIVKSLYAVLQEQGKDEECTALRGKYQSLLAR